MISPEGCASILWRDGKKNVQAAEALRLTAPDLLALGIVDDVIAEPLGGAHRDGDAAAAAVKTAVRGHLDALRREPEAGLPARRLAKYRRMGVYREGGAN